MATNWDAIRTEYVAGIASIRQLAEAQQVSENALEKRAARQKWAEARRNMSEKVLASADAKIIETKVDELAEFNASDLKIAKAMRSQIAGHLRAAQTGAVLLNPMDIATLMRAQEAAQRVGRLALGASTDISSLTIETDDDTSAIAAAERMERIAAAGTRH